MINILNHIIFKIYILWHNDFFFQQNSINLNIIIIIYLLLNQICHYLSMSHEVLLIKALIYKIHFLNYLLMFDWYHRVTGKYVYSIYIMYKNVYNIYYIDI